MCVDGRFRGRSGVASPAVSPFIAREAAGDIGPSFERAAVLSAAKLAIVTTKQTLRQNLEQMAFPCSMSQFLR